MKTLEIKKQGSQYTYRITSFGKELVATQFGCYNKDETIKQAFARFGKAEVLDLTQCTVSVLDRDGVAKVVTMTQDCFDRTTSKSTGFSQDKFLGRIIAQGGVAVVDDCPF